MKPKIQVALDLTELSKALHVASEVSEYIDYIEAGTPLIKVEGLRCVSVLKKEFGDKAIVADLKTVDTGYLEAALAYSHGADYTTVLGLSDIKTIEDAIRARDEYKRGLMIDLLNVCEAVKVLELDKLGPDYLIVHSGIDMQHRGIAPFQFLSAVLSVNPRSKIGVAGGLNKYNVELLRNLKVDLIVVGGAITKSENPRRSAKEIYDIVCTF